MIIPYLHSIIGGTVAFTISAPKPVGVSKSRCTMPDNVGPYKKPPSATSNQIHIVYSGIPVRVFKVNA